MLCFIRQNCIRKFNTNCMLCKPTNSGYQKTEISLESLIERYQNKLLFNSNIEKSRLKQGYKKNSVIMAKRLRYEEKLKNTLATIQPLPLSLKYAYNVTLEPKEEKRQLETEEKILTQFPYQSNVPVNNDFEDKTDNNECALQKSEKINNEIRNRNKLLNDMQNWMTNYDNYESDLVDSEKDDGFSSEVNYGTPDPTSQISNLPCGGCGALLHCKDTAIPGYIPSEIFKNHGKAGGAPLSALICQRCYFLKEHNMALQVRVSPDDYPKVLKTIQGKRALVILMVDLMDFPCSIWPGISEILGPKIPIVVVGNKVDLLPKDDTKYLKHIRQILLDNIKLSGFATTNIKHVSLISAKTGFGVEELITTLYSLWQTRGDVYLVGCTNVGKSSLFNALLQSDYCKIQAADLIQRATTSIWPGTTLNLLKFPISRLSGYRVILRVQRLKKQQKINAIEDKRRSELLKEHNTPKYATLMGHIDRSYDKPVEVDETKDNFSVQGSPNASGNINVGINEKLPDYQLSKWCYDTPGVVQPDQILHLLTTNELVKTLPKQLIRPETFCVKVGTTLFIAGLARLDYVEGPGSIRLTVFRSNELPVTICNLKEADSVYKELLGTELFQVPEDNEDRLNKWCGLQLAKSFTLTGTDWKTSSNDVVLSSAGWVAVNCSPNQQYHFHAWTPEKRGVYIRDCILPKAVALRGARIRFSVAYKAHRFI